MKFFVVLPFVFALAAPLANAAEDHSKHGAGAPHKLELNAGKKWATDKPLRKAMSEIRKTAVGTLDAVHHGKDTPAAFDAAAKAITAEVSYAVANCKLDPKADAQLHVVIGDILKGTEVLEGKQPEVARAEGVVAVARALNAYGEHFNHPGWKAIDLGH